MKRLRKVPVGTLFGALVAAYIAFYLVQTVRHNYQLQQQISSQQQQIAALQNNNQTLNYQIQYYNTDDYKEKEARAKLGLQAPGEGVVILPHSGNDQSTIGPSSSKPTPAPKVSNWQQWLNFLAGKPLK